MLLRAPVSLKYTNAVHRAKNATGDQMSLTAQKGNPASVSSINSRVMHKGYKLCPMKYWTAPV